MKKWIFIITSLFIVACGSKSSNNNNDATTAATTPLTTSCLNGTTNCDNSVYGNYYGWQSYPGTNPYYTNGMGNYYQNGLYRFCGCPTGSIPAYNGSMGLGCVSGNAFPGNIFPSNAYQWSLGSGYSWSFTLGFGNAVPLQTGNNMINFGQISNTQGYSANTCYSGVAQACYVDQVGSCGNGAQCIATSGGSRLGVCSNGATTTNVNPYYNTNPYTNSNPYYSGYNYSSGGGFRR